MLQRVSGRLIVAANRSVFDHTTVLGIPVILGDERANAEVVEALAESVALVEEHTPWMLSRVRRSTSGIYIRMRGAPAYSYGTKYVEVGSDWILGYPRPLLATSLVLAWQRARLGSLPGESARIDRAVFDAAVRFARRLPDNAAILATLTDLFDTGSALPGLDRVEHRRRRQARRDVEELAAMGMPRWLQWCYLRGVRVMESIGLR